jgi:3-hydroxybutyrate dehydrogenase
MTGELRDRTALVTGSVQGIGLAIARALAGAGARIAVHGIAGDAQIRGGLRTNCADAGAPARSFSTPTCATPRIEGMMKAVAAWGGADILVNNAGIQNTAPWRDAARDLGRDPRRQPVGARFTPCRRRCPRWPCAAMAG